MKAEYIQAGRRVVAIALGTALILSAVGCAQNKPADEGQDTSANGGNGPTAGPEAPGYDISPEIVSPEGCLNMELLYQQIAGLPDQAYVRHYTREFSSDAKDLNGTAARDKFRKVLTVGAFQFTDLPIHRYRQTMLSFRQNGCSDVTLIDGEQGQVLYKIEKATSQELHLKYDESHRMRVRLQDKRSLNISEDYVAMDFCPTWDGRRRATVYQEVPSQRTQVFRWGPPEMISERQETVSVQMLRNIADALSTPPVDLTNLLQSVTTAEAPVMIETLRQVQSSQIAIAMHVCPHVSTAPDGEEPPPLPDEVELPPEDGSGEGGDGPEPGPTPGEGIDPTPDVPPPAEEVPPPTPVEDPTPTPTPAPVEDPAPTPDPVEGPSPAPEEEGLLGPEES